jgi:hypothetical protein
VTRWTTRRYGKKGPWAGFGLAARGDGAWLYFELRNLWSRAPRLRVWHLHFEDWRSRKAARAGYAKLKDRQGFRQLRDGAVFEYPVPELGWDPSVSGGGSNVAVSGASVIVAGDFSSVGGQGRVGFAALDAATGTRTAWIPNLKADGFDRFVATALAVRGDTVYVAGQFGSIGGEIRNSLAALDAATGTAGAWNPKPDGPVEALAVTQQSVYAGGGSGLTGFLTRLDPETGATTWDLKANGAGRGARIRWRAGLCGRRVRIQNQEGEREVSAGFAAAGLLLLAGAAFTSLRWPGPLP